MNKQGNTSINSKIKKIYLHVGLYKTATTSIQESLYDNRSLLKRLGNGYLYSPKFGISHGKPFVHMFTDKGRGVFSTSMIYRGKSYVRWARKTLLKELKSTKCSNVIFSAEYIWEFEKSNIEGIKNFF